MFHDGTVQHEALVSEMYARLPGTQTSRYNSPCQFGKVFPSFEGTSRSSKNSSTEWPMLTGASSRLLFVTALIRRSYEHERQIEGYKGR